MSERRERPDLQPPADLSARVLIPRLVQALVDHPGLTHEEMFGDGNDYIYYAWLADPSRVVREHRDGTRCIVRLVDGEFLVEESL